MLTGYFYWWYGAGFIQAWQVAIAVLYETADFFSLELLVKTWLAPWKNDTLTLRNAALSDQVKIWEQNLASRFIGFVLRTIIIVVAIILLGCLTIGLAVGLVAWLFAPLFVLLLPVLAAWKVSQ